MWDSPQLHQYGCDTGVCQEKSPTLTQGVKIVQRCPPVTTQHASYRFSKIAIRAYHSFSAQFHPLGITHCRCLRPCSSIRHRELEHFIFVYCMDKLPGLIALNHFNCGQVSSPEYSFGLTCSSFTLHGPRPTLERPIETPTSDPKVGCSDRIFHHENSAFEYGVRSGLRLISNTFRCGRALKLRLRATFSVKLFPERLRLVSMGRVSASRFHVKGRSFCGESPSPISPRLWSLQSKYCETGVSERSTSII